MPAAKMVDVKAIIDERPLGRVQIRIMMLCSLVALLDGFDAQAISFVAAALAKEFDANVASFGPVFGAGTLGMTLGALTLPVLGDRWGRRALVIASVIVFGVLSLATVWVQSFQQLLLLRFLTGLGVGAAVPCMIPLISEYSPSRLSTITITVVTCSWPLGAVLGGAVSALLIPVWGWKSVFILGGVLPLLLAGALLIYLPESLRFLASRGGYDRDIGLTLGRIFPDLSVSPEDRFSHTEPVLKGAPVGHLLSDGRATMTLLLWASFLMNFLVLFFIFNWLPPLLQQADIPVERAVLGAVLFNLGGVLGCVLLGMAMGRFGNFVVVAGAYAVGMIGVVAIGMFSDSLGLILACVFIVGFSLVGAQACGNALVSSLYPTSIRSTAIGWAYGIGRIGSIIGPVAGGMLLTLGWGMSGLFWIAALPLLIASIAMFVLHFSMSKQQRRLKPSPVTP